MKTKRILAASTAALLAFGTTAVVSTTAFAAVTYDNMAIAVSATTAASDSTEAQIKALVTGVTGDVTDEDTPANSQTGATLASGTDYTLSVSGSGPWTITATGASNWDGKSATKTITVAQAPAGDESGAGSSFDNDDPDKYEEFTKDGIDADADASVTTGSAITKSAATLSVSATVKDPAKFKGYEMQVAFANAPAQAGANSAKVSAAKADIGVDLTTKQKSEIEKLNVSETVILKVALAKEKNKDGDLASTSKAPAPITFAISNLDANVHVYHLGKNSIEEIKVTMDSTIGSGKTATFQAQNFSDFIITKGEIKKGLTAAADADESGTSAAASNAGTSSTNPNTGIALAIAPVVLAAGAVAVVALKKKH